MNGPTLKLSPWAGQALSTEDRDRISKRLVDLHVRMSVTGTPWTLRAESWDHANRMEVFELVGNLAFHIDGFLDAWERRYCYTAEELVTIASQSGMAVRRA